MKTARYDDTEFEIVFSGRELLCVPEPEPVKLRILPPPVITADAVESRRSFDEVRQVVFRAMLAKECWTIIELREQLNLDGIMLGSIMQRAKGRGLIRSVSYGVVTLTPLGREAAL